MVIVSFYIECKRQVALEQLLRDNDYAFYDATESDMLTGLLSNHPTLDEIEVMLGEK